MILTDSIIQKKLQNLPGWTTNGQKITKLYKFANFIKAIDFVNLLVKPAEEANHHPDISISYNKVTIDLTTHDEGGITQKDLDLAEIIASIAEIS
jgi:4a-hydroxytetrahydrobiopterin dehydratase